MAKRLPFAERATHCKNELARQLFILLNEKQSNLALSADVNSCATLLELAERLGPEICVLKTHVDILDDFSIEFANELCAIAQKHQFYIFEDRKFADIGHTVKQQYQGGIYHIADWADIINAHTLPGPGIIAGLAEVGLPKKRALLLLAEMSSANNLINNDYTEKTVQMAEQFPEFVAGFIAQKKLSKQPQWIYMTPGVQSRENTDSLGQQYITPEQAILENESDIIIVGRGIIAAKDPRMAAQKYRHAAWDSYHKSLLKK